MKTEIGSVIRNTALALTAIFTITQITAMAEVPFIVDPQADAASQAAQQAIAANQQAMQTAQQANQQAMQAAQQANQQAMQDAQQAAQNMDIGTPGIIYSRQPPPPANLSGAVPPQIMAGHKVFLTNAGADTNFPVSEPKAYHDVYAALQQWGRFQLVDSPGDADLIFSLRDIAPVTNVNGYGRTGVYAITSPAFQVTIFDAHTNNVLWTVTSPVEVDGSKQKRAQWYALSVNNLVSRFKALTNQPLTAQENAQLTTYPHSHALRNGLIIGGAATATLLIVGLVVRRNSKNSTDAFCSSHNIPPSMCAGG